MIFGRPLPWIGVIVFSLVLLSCTKVQVVGPQGPSGPQGDTGYLPSGDVMGTVYLYDINGNPLTADSGATVSVDNTSPLLDATTGINGAFTIPSVPSGKYNLSVERQGFGTMRLLGFQNSGGATGTYTPLLSTAAIPSYAFKAVSADTVSIQDNPYSPIVPEIWVTLTVEASNTATLNFPVIAYFYDSADVSPSRYLYQSTSTFFAKNDTTIVLSFDIPFSTYSPRLGSAPYVYMVFAIDNPLSLSYVDENGTTIFPCIGNVSPVTKVYNNLK